MNITLFSVVERNILIVFDFCTLVFIVGEEKVFDSDEYSVSQNSWIFEMGGGGATLTQAQATAALTRLKPIWIDKSISLSSKYD